MIKNKEKVPITFFYTDNCERQAIEPIAQEAIKRGYKVLFSMDSGNYAEVGVYCQHACVPNSRFSVVMLHDLAQRHDIWPNFWSHEPWNRFDIGFLPGQSWVERWHNQSHLPYSRTRYGVFNTGWPKSDIVYNDIELFKKKGESLRKILNLKHEKTILYAPSWENDRKQDEFVKSFVDLPVNLLIKQAPWPESYTEVLENIREMKELHLGLSSNIHIVDPELSIMYCLCVSDVIVSDESSVLTEALLVGVPPVAVVDWLIPDRKPHRFASVPYEYVKKTTKSRLRDEVVSIINNAGKNLSEIYCDRDQQFSHLGKSSVVCMDLIEDGIAGLDSGVVQYRHLSLESQLNVDRFEYQRSNELLLSGNESDAVNILMNLINRKTSCWEVYCALGEIAFKNNDFNSAATFFNKSAPLSSNRIFPMAKLMDLYMAASRNDLACSQFIKICGQLPPSDFAVRKMRAFVEAFKNINLR